MEKMVSINRDAELERLRAEVGVLRNAIEYVVTEESRGYISYCGLRYKHEATIRLALSQTRPSELLAAVEEALESLALMAEGEGPDPQDYMDMAKHAHTELKKALHGEVGE